MTKRHRQRLFYLLSGIFAIAGAGTILYSYGWRISLAPLQIKTVGAIYVRSFPADAEILLNGEKIQNGSGIFQNGTLVNGLFPRTYRLELRKDSYKPWAENTAVSPSLVTELKYAVLIPNAAEEAATGTKNFLIADGVLITGGEDGNLRVDGKKIGRGALVDAASGAVLYKDGGYWLSSPRENPVNVSVALKSAGFAKNDFLPRIDQTGGGRLFVIEPQKISLLETSRPSLKTIAKAAGQNTIGDAAPDGPLLAWTEYDPDAHKTSFFIYDEFLGRTTASFELGGRNKKIGWAKNALAAVQEDGGFFVYDLNQRQVQKIADDARDLAFSDDGKKAAVAENKSLEIFSLDGSGDYWRFNLPDAASIAKIIWYKDSRHLFVTYPGETRFLDLDDKTLANFSVAAQSSDAQYDAGGNALYFLKNGALFEQKFPD